VLHLELAADLAIQVCLVGFDAQEEVGPLLLELPQNRSLVVLASGVAGLTDRHTQGCGIERHLGNERGAAAGCGLDRAATSIWWKK
jgi:hypothetical protein